MPQTWIVRAGPNDEYQDLSFSCNVVVVGWWRTGDLTEHPTWSDIHTIVQTSYPDVSAFTLDTYTRQLYAFRSIMAVGDYVLLVRSTTPEVAMCEILADYEYRPDLTARHTRPVRWLRRDMHRAEVGVDLFDTPALAVVHHVNKPGVQHRLQRLVGNELASDYPTSDRASERQVEAEVSVETPETSDAYKNLTKNLNYARNLTAAGKHFSELGITKFEISDVYRAAWVQAVAALDQWVRREIHERMLRLANDQSIAKSDRYRSFEISLGAVEDVQAGRRTLHDALDERLRDKLGFTTYQDPVKIRQGFAHITDVASFWNRVAVVLGEQAGGERLGAGDVEQRLRDIAYRRNKIAHEYDEDPLDSSRKRDIGAEATMKTIEFIDQVAAAITLVLGAPSLTNGNPPAA